MNGAAHRSSHTSKAAASPGSSSSPASETSSSPIRSTPAGARPTNSSASSSPIAENSATSIEPSCELVDHDQVEHSDQLPVDEVDQFAEHATVEVRLMERERDQLDRTERFGECSFRPAMDHAGPSDGSLDVGRPFHLHREATAPVGIPLLKRDTVITLAGRLGWKRTGRGPTRRPSLRAITCHRQPMEDTNGQRLHVETATHGLGRLDRFRRLMMIVTGVLGAISPVWRRSSATRPTCSSTRSVWMFDQTSWGWIHLIIGILVVVVGAMMLRASRSAWRSAPASSCST